MPKLEVPGAFRGFARRCFNRPRRCNDYRSGRRRPAARRADPARGEIDTGCNVTAVSAALLRRLGVPVQFRSTSQTASGSVVVDVFKVSVGVRDLGDPTGLELVQSTLSVMELTTPLGTVEVLVGINFLLGCKFLFDGLALKFCLEF